MQYIIVEIQTMKNGETETTAVVPPVVYDNYNQAEAKFHTVLAAAAVSEVSIHSCVLMNNVGDILRTERYDHINATTSGQA